MLEIYTWSVFIAGLCFVGFGVFAFLSDRNHISNKIFGLFSASFAVWCFSWFLALLFSDVYSLSLFFARLLNFGATMMPVLYLHWVITLTRKEKDGGDKVIVWAYIISFLLGIISFSRFYVSGLHSIYEFPVWPTAGPLYILPIIICYGLFVGYALYLLIKKIIQSKGEPVVRYQLEYIVVGTVLGFGGGMTNFPLMYKVNFIFGDYIVLLGVWSIMVSAFVYSYAAIRYRLMNIKLIAVEVFTGIVVVSFLINLIVAKDINQKLIAFVLLVVVVIFSILIIRGVLGEISQREHIEKLLKMRSEFLNIASHQLKTPISVIVGTASMFRDGTMDKVPKEEQAKFMDHIYFKALKLGQIIRDILEASEFDTEKFELPKQRVGPVDLAEMLQKIYDERKNDTEEKKITLNFKKVKEKVRFILSDPNYLEQALANLVDNAIKYTLVGSVNIVLDDDGKNIIVKVWDTGIGIPEGDQAKLFGKFERASNAIKMYTDGTGLGLYIVKEVVEAHPGASIKFKSQEGRGTEFILSFLPYTPPKTPL